jgi:hypothetical protein
MPPLGFAVGVLVVSLAACGIPSSEAWIGSPKVAATFGVGAGPMPDLAADPAIHKAYVTSGMEMVISVPGDVARTSN